MRDIQKRRSWLRSRAGAALLIASVSAAGVISSTSFDEPPRFDGAGYAMLARSMLDGLGYRDIDHPDASPHVHFPPGYPLSLAAVWAMTDRSLTAAHAFSIACTVTAVVVSWAWFRWLYPARVALLLGLALAMNWTWHRSGGAIRSEPLYMLLQQLALLATVAAMRGGAGQGVSVGAWLGSLTLTRLVGAIIGVAIALELLVRRRIKALLSTIVVAAVVVAPWAWRLVSTPSTTHLDYFPSQSVPEVIFGNAWFYMLRIPDALSAPLIEVGTVFVPRAAPVAGTLAVMVTAVFMIGLVRAFRSSRRRLAGLVVVCNLALLLIWPFTEAGRFLIPLVPPLLVVALEGMTTIVRRINPTRLHPRTLAAALLLALATPYSLYAALTGRAEAERRLQGVVDPAFTWIAESGDRPGPIMTIYPAEAFWFTGRPGLTSLPLKGEPDVAGQIDRYGVAYLVATESRFARALDDPISQFVADHPDRVELRWSSDDETIRVFEVIAPSEDLNFPRPEP
ncbi:glycosyltransferase family 39 protein [Tautonia rosea]|uniref:glycosyltransferase family 39 protein n=1 Tax=Tautonia rosea TaxID=2728037 RepID=UPI001475536E|nr:glycosyltransferase family 39 protein [Tautonia rosea]